MGAQWSFRSGVTRPTSFAGRQLSDYRTTAIFNGTILAYASITVNTGAAMNGRALAQTGDGHIGYQYDG